MRRFATNNSSAEAMKKLSEFINELQKVDRDLVEFLRTRNYLQKVEGTFVKRPFLDSLEEAEMHLRENKLDSVGLRSISRQFKRDLKEIQILLCPASFNQSNEGCKPLPHDTRYAVDKFYELSTLLLPNSNNLKRFYESSLDGIHWLEATKNKNRTKEADILNAAIQLATDLSRL
ncbi:unnamed protein product [Nippostrongylus brasiliensis]|uniref:Translin n=1 Tax=Nippostrongylus brasiliensis TaxID=27835 RepID=A0A0N4Y694_NIPBR|nr:hypothetical protein Q1695_013054 [Nippostrongylus brasiliensis]VDL75183.1 unnamed protein product [Nippostrongylus brasiliensis]